MVVFCGRLIDSNAYPPCLRGLECILVYSGCLEQQGIAWLLDDPRFEKCAAFSACPEEHHVNMLGFKLLGMVARSGVKRIVAVTVDGSMHCIQLHYMLEELENILGEGRVERLHFVVERRRLVEIPAELVKLSRFLSKLRRLIEGRDTSPSRG